MRSRAKRSRIWFPLLFGILANASLHGSTNTTKVELDAGEKRTEIRKQLLHYTPLKSTPEEVLKFIRSRLGSVDETKIVLARHPAEGPSAAQSKKRGVSVIKLDAADPKINPFLFLQDLPMPDESGLFIQWAFDEQDRLIEIFLDRDLGGT